MSKSPVLVTAEFTQDLVSGEWIATSQTPRLTGRGMQVRQARDALASQLTEQLGQPVQIEDKVKLPKDLAAEVAAYQRDLALEEKLRTAREENVVPLAKKLLRQRLQMQQVAQILRISKAWLGQVLKRDSTGSYRT